MRVASAGLHFWFLFFCQAQARFERSSPIQDGATREKIADLSAILGPGRSGSGLLPNDPAFFGERAEGRAGCSSALALHFWTGWKIARRLTVLSPLIRALWPVGVCGKNQ